MRRPRRVEVITGPERRRDWPDEQKIAIIAEALEPGANISAVAGRHDMNPQQLFGWRAEAEALIEGRLAPAPVFAPVAIEATSPMPPPLSVTPVRPVSAFTQAPLHLICKRLD